MNQHCRHCLDRWLDASKKSYGPGRDAVLPRDAIAKLSAQ